MYFKCLKVTNNTGYFTRSNGTSASQRPPALVVESAPGLRAAAAACLEDTVSVQLLTNYRFLFFLEFPLLDIFSVSISSLCLDRVSFMLHRWSLIMLNWSS